MMNERLDSGGRGETIPKNKIYLVKNSCFSTEN